LSYENAEQFFQHAAKTGDRYQQGDLNFSAAVVDMMRLGRFQDLLQIPKRHFRESVLLQAGFPTLWLSEQR